MQTETYSSFLTQAALNRLHGLLTLNLVSKSKLVVNFASGKVAVPAGCLHRQTH